MGFRNPITSAEAVDTGRGPSDAGVRLYQDTSVPAVPRGVAEWRTGQMARNSTVSLSGGGSGGSAFTIDGGAPLAGLDAPKLNLNVEALPGGGYGPAARLGNLTGGLLDFGNPGTVQGLPGIGDTGWLPLDLATGFASIGACVYRVRNGWAAVFITALASAGWAAGALLLKTPLPAEARPSVVAWSPGNVSGSSSFDLVMWPTSGNVQLLHALAGSQDIRISHTFPVN